VKILLVSGGMLPIPPVGWGGVENIIHQQRLYLERQGHTVDILNARKHKFWSALKTIPWRYDAIHIHLDSLSGRWLKLHRLKPLPVAVTSHYAFAAFPEHWSEDYQRAISDALQLPNQIVLGQEVADTLLARGYTGALFVLPNGIDVSKMAFQSLPTQNAAILLGRVESRKRQVFLSEILTPFPDALLDLVGPLLASETPEDFHGNSANVRYLGKWTREEVTARLTEYPAMVLISDGEAHAGVLLEALAAGQSLIVNRESVNGFDATKPWVYLVDPKDPKQIADAIQRAIIENPIHRAAIRQHALETFDWAVIGPRYEAILKQISGR
jgi:glycosyltransferase involved in cell wall biosynthesis